MILLALCGVAEAHPDWESLKGGAWLHYELTGLQALDHQPPVQELVLVGARLHGFIGGEHVGFHAGLDLAGGGTIDAGGFAYDVALLPLGVAVRIGGTSVIALGAGVGALGGIPSLDGAVTLPAELTIELGGGSVRLLGRARAAYIAGAAYPDELDGMLGVRVGHHYHDYGFPSGNGYFVALSARELERTRYVGVTIGYSIDLGTRR
jgi:hypothetical protein